MLHLGAAGEPGAPSGTSPMRTGVTPNFPWQGRPANPHVPPGPKVESFAPTNDISGNVSSPHVTEIVHTFEWER